MSRAEQIPILQAKSQVLLDWFIEKELPACPFQMNNHTAVHDVNKFMETQQERMAANWKNPFNPVFVNAYKSLEQLKKYIEYVIENNGEARPMQKTDGFRNIF